MPDLGATPINMNLPKPDDPIFDNEPCAMPHEAAIRALMIEQDQERARLRGRIRQLEQVIEDAGLTPPAGDGQGMADAYRAHQNATNAVLGFFHVQEFGLQGLPAELHETFRPLVIS